jgi:hypothetical protein
VYPVYSQCVFSAVFYIFGLSICHYAQAEKMAKIHGLKLEQGAIKVAKGLQKCKFFQMTLLFSFRCLIVMYYFLFVQMIHKTVFVGRLVRIIFMLDCFGRHPDTDRRPHARCMGPTIDVSYAAL